MAHELNEYLAAKKASLSPLLILTHDHPDPDSMASAMALQYLAAEEHGIRSRIVYGGIIGRMENQVMKRELKIPMSKLRTRDLQADANVALVDTQPPFANNPFPVDSWARLVLDHHPLNKKTKAEFTLVRPNYGATSTIVAEALLDTKLRIPKNLATALVYGISSETQNLGREESPEDIKVYTTLFPQVSMKSLARIEHPPRSDEYFASVGRAVQQAFHCGRVIGVHLGRIRNPDLVSQTADFLLNCHGKTWSLCTGRYRDRLHVSLRTSNVQAEAGKILQQVLEVKGAAGGHDMIAGGALVIGKGASEKVWSAAEARVATRLMQRLGYKREAPFEKAF